MAHIQEAWSLSLYVFLPLDTPLGQAGFQWPAQPTGALGPAQQPFTLPPFPCHRTFDFL